MKYSINNIFWIILAVITTATPIVCVLQYNKYNNVWWLALALILYILLIISYINLLKSFDMVDIYPLLKILAIIMVVLMGVLLFGESLDTSQIFGIIFGIIAVYLLS
ncbi:MAG: hypothetical protein Edafosvirus1_145 [Edafosvirus sp.]|uniref:EamA domain-containing protein n=1 Tax=Edafosvirus sp. TaxID=2487765 RepID=A0A3G4ZU25_9VIRU|nr:MAG: hypothetical protein Edafosvirus1_145 [Edafosvirus sp.]